MGVAAVRSAEMRSKGRRVPTPAWTRESAMPPTPAELREQSRIFRDAALKAATPDLKRRLAQYALSIALAAESVERGGQIPDTVLVALREQQQLLTEALDGGAPVPPAPPSKPETVPKVQDQIRQWRMRAEELRTTADQFQVPSAQDALRNAALNYLMMADNLEAQLGGHPPAPGGKAS